MYTYRASVTVPNRHRERATALLRTELKRRILADKEPDAPDWTTLTVTGPIEDFDAHGTVCFHYRASVNCLNVREVLAAARG